MKQRNDELGEGRHTETTNASDALVLGDDRTRFDLCVPAWSKQ